MCLWGTHQLCLGEVGGLEVTSREIGDYPPLPKSLGGLSAAQVRFRELCVARMSCNVDKEPLQARPLGRVSVGKLHLDGGRGQSTDDPRPRVAVKNLKEPFSFCSQLLPQS